MFDPSKMASPRIYEDGKVIGTNPDIVNQNIDYIRKVVGSYYLNAGLNSKETAANFVKCASWYSKRFSGSYNHNVEHDLTHLMQEKGLLSNAETKDYFQQGYGATAIPTHIPEYVNEFTDKGFLAAMEEIEREFANHSENDDDQKMLDQVGKVDEGDVNDWVSQNRPKKSADLK